MSWTSSFYVAMPPEAQAHERPSILSDADWAALRTSQSADYDGHTEFVAMTPDQRLRWLEGAVQFVQAARASARMSSS